MSDRRDLDRRRLARKHGEPVAGGMTGEIDEDIDLVGLDAVGELVITELPGVDPSIGQPAALLGRLIARRKAGITDDLEIAAVTVMQQRHEAERSRMATEVRGDNTEHEPPLGTNASLVAL